MPAVGAEAMETDKNAKVGKTMDSGGNIEHLYMLYDRLNNAENKVTLERDFRELLSAVKGTDKEKRLASQFVSRFLEYFPLLYTDGIDALLDLCEDDDISIRKQVEKDLIGVCKKITTFVPKIADVYAQLMQTGDATELSCIQNCLTSLFHIDAKATIVGIFSQIGSGEDIVRARCLKFLSTQLKELSPELTNDAFETTLLASVKRVIPDMNSEDIKTLMQLLMDTKLLKTVSGQQALVDMVAEQIDLEKDFDTSEAENFDRLLIFFKHISPLFSSQVSVTPFLIYVCKKVLPHLSDALLLEEGNELVVEILKMMAELSSSVRRIEHSDALECVKIVYSKLLEILPLPPEDDLEHTAKYDFNHVECYLYVLHSIGKEASEFLADTDLLKEFRLRLQYFARSSQAYQKKLKEDLNLAQADAELREENRIKIYAYKVIANINLIIKDFFHTPPMYKADVRLSWKPIKHQVAPPGANKRKIAMPNSNSNRNQPPSKTNRGNDRERVLYQPPSGKFSKRSGPYSSPPSSRGGRGGNNFRGGPTKIFRGGGGGGGGRNNQMGQNRRPFQRGKY